MLVDQDEDMLLKNRDFSNISKTIQVIMYQLLFLFGV
jgi:hypothetical protein